MKKAKKNITKKQRSREEPPISILNVDCLANIFKYLPLRDRVLVERGILYFIISIFKRIFKRIFMINNLEFRNNLEFHLDYNRYFLYKYMN